MENLHNHTGPQSLETISININWEIPIVKKTLLL